MLQALKSPQKARRRHAEPSISCCRLAKHGDGIDGKVPDGPDDRVDAKRGELGVPDAGPVRGPEPYQALHVLHKYVM